MNDVLIEQSPQRPGILTLRFNRPHKKNAITQAMYQAMTEALLNANANPSIRAIVFLGTEGCFSAGNDLQDFISFATSGSIDVPAAFAFIKALAHVQKPMLSAVDGLAIGIGTTLHFHCDLTFASPRAVFKTPFVDLALVPEAGSSLLAPQIIGQQRAFALLGLGEAMSAEEALAAGMIYKILPSEALEEAVFQAAISLCAKPPQALALTRQLLRGDPARLIARMEEEALLFAERLKSDEARAAFLAFMARSSPAG